MWCAEKVAVSGECCQKSFQNGAIVTTISRNGGKKPNEDRENVLVKKRL